MLVALDGHWVKIQLVVKNIFAGEIGQNLVKKNLAIIKQFLSYGSDGFEMVFMNFSVLMRWATEKLVVIK